MIGLPSAVLLPAVLLPAVLLVLIAPAALTAVERVVVLPDGNTFVGQITRTQSRVIVQQGSQQLAFGADEVDFVADSLADAYGKKAARVPKGNKAVREKLLMWCIQQHLPQYARMQLALLRQEHPTHPELLLWEARIDSHANLGGKNVLPTPAPVHPDVRVATEASGRLSSPAQAAFVRKIQPMLWNRCALGSCHGRSTTTNFLLISGRSRNSAQRNLGATLRQIDASQAEQTLLWTSAREVHGGAASWKITTSELTLLRQWILTVCQDLEGHGALPTTPLPAESVDPFDPAEFNLATP